MSPSDVLLRAIDFFRACGVETRATDGPFLYIDTTMKTRMRSMQHFALDTLYLVPPPEVS
jgi:hypothetical protein